MSRVGIYGGTFDPIHIGHLHVITQLIEKGIVDLLLVVPAGEPLLRSHAPRATAQQRRQMCQLALSDLPPEVAKKVQVNPIEVLRTGPSYAIDTVEAVAQNYPDDSIVLIVGQDAADKLDQWQRIDELRSMVEFVAIARPAGARKENYYDIAFASREGTEERILSTSRWPVDEQIRSYLFFFEDASGSITYRAVDEFVVEEK